MKKLRILLFVLPALLLLAGCTFRYAPHIYNVHKATVVAKTKTPSLSQVNRAIVSAGSSLGWNMQSVRPGYIVAILHIRNHMAKVGIKYSTHSYSITYITSKNLMRDGYIHKNYNSWVKNLNKAIKRELLIA